MKRKALSLLLALAMLLAPAVPAAAAGLMAVPSAQTITVDGVEKDLEVYSIAGSNYFKLRDMAALLNGTESQFSVDWDTEKNTATVLSGRPYEALGSELRTGAGEPVPCKASTQTIIINGRQAAVTAYIIGGNNFFKLRELGALLGFGVDYDSSSNTAVITSELSFAIDLTAALASGVATHTVITPKVNGKNVRVDWYVAPYTSKPNRAEDQLINIYIPEKAAKTSPILLYTGGAGWGATPYPTDTVQDGKAYTSFSETDGIGAALKEGYVIVSYGCRGRDNGQTNGSYLGHSPAAVTDTKAVIRYLRANASALPAGNTERIVVTGASGDALGAVIAASGNSPDYFPTLYEIGAAGVTRSANGGYSVAAGVGDDVFGVIAYCPVTDLGTACAAYEWTFGDTRKAMAEAGGSRPAAYDGPSDDELFAASDALKNTYAAYIDGLGLTDEEGNAVTSDNLAGHIAALMEKAIALAVGDLGVEQVKADISDNGREDNDWLTFNEDDAASEDSVFNYDYSGYLYYLAKNTALKSPSAFSGCGLPYAGQDLNDLFGAAEQAYCPFNEYSWNHDAIAGNGVGRDDTGLDWDAYMATDEGRALALQIRMTSAVDYLVEGTASIAPYWYVRHSMDDLDTSFAAATVLFYAARNSAKIDKDALNTGFSWLRPYSGGYDAQDAFDWLRDLVE